MDCFDRCPQTDTTTRVDSHGCPRDTDGDGVPDYKDIELITPTECQPSDKEGLGYCETRCCFQQTFHRDYFPDRSLFLQGTEEKVTPYIQNFLNRIITLMKSNPSFPIILKTGHSGRNTQSGKIARNRLQNFHKYITSHEIDEERIVLKLESDSLENILLVSWNGVEFEFLKKRERTE